MAFIITLSFLFTKLISEADLELKYYHRKILQSFGANRMGIVKYLIFTDYFRINKSGQKSNNLRNKSTFTKHLDW